MPSFDPDDLATWTGGRWTGRPASAPVGFSVDSRRISAGQAFIALRTDRRDGHDFLRAAMEAGASAAFVAKANPTVALAQLVVRDPLAALQAVAREHRRNFRGVVAGITGSAGKTSTKELLAAVLGGETGGVLATEGNLNNQIGVALTLTRIDPARHRYAVIEAGISAPDEMRTLAAMIEPDLAIITLVGAAHLADLGSLERVAEEKAALAGPMVKNGICIFPSSCEGYPAFRSIGRARSLVIEPSPRLGGHWHSEGRARFSVDQSAGSTTVTVSIGPPPPIAATLPRVSDGMAQNAALAICAAIHLGVKREAIAARLLTWKPPHLRGEWTISEGRRLYLDCYNANPASMADALATFRAIAPPDEPRLFVIGSMEELGAGAENYHVELGRSLGLRQGDHLVAIGALGGAVRHGAVEAGADPRQVEVADSIDPLASTVAAFHGSVFVKGSRKHGLERAFFVTEHAEASHA
jgi:UDP-N-acetylmuramoyl-tripeptide--D-alanyl-D-alanine ligase